MVRRSGKSVLALAAFGGLALWCSHAPLSTRVPVDAFVAGTPAWRSARQPAVAMQSEKVDAIVDQLKELTLLEASELVTAIEDTFGVDASASGGAVMMAAPAAGGGEEAAAAEQTEFDLVLKEVPKTSKIKVIKVIRALLDVGLKDAKEKADNPGTLLEGKPKEIVEDAKKQLEEAGAAAAGNPPPPAALGQREPDR